MATYQEVDLTGTTEWVNKTINMTSWNDDTYTVTHFGEDDHTAKSIPVMDYTITNQYIQYNAPTANVKIENENGNLKSISTDKLQDRYTFTFEPNNNRKTWDFILTSSEPLYYRGKLYSFPSFVTGKQWVDLKIVGDTATYQVTKLTAKQYRITINRNKQGKEPITFQSIGGLNNATYNYQFDIYTCVENFVNTSWVNSSTDL
jgi:hypothetical protein